MKRRTTVNGLRISYDEKTDEIIFERNDMVFTLKMGEDRLNLLYQMTPYHRYKKFLFMKQSERCGSCRKEVSYKEAILHHDPKLGAKGARYTDFKRLTRNRILCKDCHEKIRGE